jgi:hypothetical protein
VIGDVRVVGGTTIGSFFGAPAVRTIEFRLTNAGTVPAAPILIGRWGSGADLSTVIAMPRVGSILPARSVDVRVPFQVSALSVGTFNVRIAAEVAGQERVAVSTSVTTQWPIGLYAGALAVMVCLVYLLIIIWPRRFEPRREAGRVSGGASATPTQMPAMFPHGLQPGSPIGAVMSHPQLEAFRDRVG